MLTIFLLCSILILFAGNAFAIEDNNYTVSQNIENCNSGFHVQDNFIDFNINLNDSSSADDRLGVSNEDLLADPVYPGGTNFSDIRQAIVSAHDGDTIFLKNLTYTGSGSEIVVDKQVTIVGGFSLDDGLMATLNARSLSQIFVISADNVILRNINFNYGKSSTDGGAIYWNGKNGNMSYCNFFNNTAMTYGGAVYWNSLNGNVANVIFTDNAAKDDTSYDYGGGAIYWKAANGKLSNAKFINNYARRGGAVYWAADNSNLSNIEFTNNTGWFGAALYWWGKYGKLSYSNFTNNSGDKGGTGGAFYIDQRGSYHDVSYCNFVNNSAVKVESGLGGGAIAWYATYGNLSFSNFTENHVNFAAGAVLWNGNYGNLWNCTFYKNYADGYAKSSYSGSLYKSGDAGAVRWVSRFGNLTNSTFIENYAWNSGGALWGDQIDATIDNCIFINNSAKDSNGGSIYWSTGGSTVEHAPKIINSVFINSTAKGFGGSINWDAPHANLINLTFINSSSEGYGAGAVAISGDYSLVYGCNFTNCTTKGNGGGLRSTMSFTNVTHCNFINTSAEGYKNYDGPGGGGAIYLYSQGSYISYSTFVNSSTAADGGALNLHATGIRVFNCSFENTSAKLDGGAISRKTHDVTVFDNLTFINSIAETGSGGAIYWKEPGVYTSTYMARCNFTNTSANQLGGAIYREQTNLIFDVNIVNTSAKQGGAIYFKYYGGSVSNVSVINTSATEKGGAIYSYSFFAPITNVSIINTTAGIDGGAIYLEYSESTLRNITCINASAKNFGGSIYSGYWGDWYDLKFINSSALDGGAIYKNYDTGNIVNATFINTTANRDGGAVYWTYYRDYNSKKSLINASFTNSHAKRDGGSIFWQAYKATFKNLTFNISSADRDGGAIFWNTTDANITELNFTNITAGRNGGAVYVNGAKGNINNCNFTNNSAGNNGGALYWNGINGNLTSSNFDLNHASNNGGAIYWNAIAGNVEHSLLTNNTAIYGGGIYWRGNDGIINDLEFMGNNATNGSAIYKDRNSNSLTVTNVQFDKNRANAHHIEIEIEGNESYSLADVTVNIYLVANDNIANAIWNDGANNTILLANITCVYSENGIKRPEHTFNALTNPICPTYEIKDNSTLWQSPYEYAQLLDVVVTNPEGTVIYNLVDGKLQRTKSNTKNLLSAIKFDDEDINVTDKDGKIHIEFTNLEAGKYTIAAEHKWDKYYTNTVNRDNFIIYDLNVTKTTDDVLVTVGHNVTYNITIFNNGSQIAKDIKISDLIPSQLKLVDYNINWLNRSAPDWTLDYNENTNEFTIHNSNQFGDESFIPPFEKVLITLVFKSINLGTFNNTVSVLSNVTGDKPTNATSQNTTVVPVVLNVNKTVDVSPVVNNTVVNFTICVSNVGLGNATNIVVVDELPAGLVFVDGGIVDDSKGVVVYLGQFGNGGKWNISGLNSTDVVCLWVSARVNVTGAITLTNKVNVTSRENDTEVKNFTDVVVVPVVLNVNKTVDVSPVVNNTVVNFTICVSNVGLGNATDLTVVDSLPAGLTVEDLGVIGVSSGIDVTFVRFGNGGKWIISGLNSTDVVCLWITARTNGTGVKTNKINVTSRENDTEVKNFTDVVVVPVVLNVNKTVDVSPVVNNTVVNFTICVSNVGLGNATDLVVVDELPVGLVFVDGGIVDDSKGVVVYLGQFGNGGKWNISGLNYTDVVSLWISAHVNVVDAMNLTNKVNVTCVENDTEVKNFTDVEVVPVVLNVNKTVDVSPVVNNTVVNFTICVSNVGLGNATDLIVVDSLPAGLTVEDLGVISSPVGVDVTFVRFGNGGKWNISGLNSTDVVSLWITARTNVVDAMNLTNKVNVTCAENDTEVKNFTDVEVVPVVLNINKTANVTIVANNTLVKYVVVVKNNCNFNATDLVICDELPDGLIFENDATSGYYWDESTRVISWNLTKLDAGSIVEYYVVVRTNGTGFRTNKVNVTCVENDTEVKNSTTIEVVPVNLTIVKTATPGEVKVNENVTFTITVTNYGPANATGVNITDVLDDVFKFDGKSANGTFKVADKTIVWEIGNLTKGSSYSVCFNVTVLTNGTFLNVGTVSCTENSTEVSNKTDVAVLPIVDLKINKTVDKTNVTVGDEVIYTICVTNLGPSNATNVNVTDVMKGIVKITNVEIHNIGKFDEKEGIWYIGNLNKDATVYLTLTVKTLSVGIVENVVSVNSTEEDKNTSNNEYLCENVTVNPAPSLVNGSDVNVTYGEPIVVDYDSVNATNVTYEIFDSGGNPILNGTVGPDGSIPVDQLPVGNYTVIWTTVVDANHTSATNTSVIIVNLAPSLVNGSDVNVTYGESIVVDYDSVNATNVTYEIFDSGGNPILNGTVGPDGSIPVDQLPVGNYTVIWTTVVDANHTSATNTSKITVNPIPTHIVVGNVTARPGDNVTIPINVTADDGVLFNGNVTVILPDGTVRVVEIINGKGSVPWTVPDNYNGTYPVFVSFGGNAIYLASNGTGFVIVIPDNPEPVNPEPENHTVNEEPSIEVPMDNKATGNPILILFLLLLTLVFPQLRRFKK